MRLMRGKVASASLVMGLLVLALLAQGCPRARADAAMLMEEPFGFFGFMNPTGHDAVYFERICAETPVKLRRCAPGELGAVITRYQGIDHYDWIAMPLLPYLYAVESASEVPAHVDHETMNGLRDKYHEAHLQSLGDVPRGGDAKRGWSQFVGVSYDRRIYAFRFATSEAQDDALIAKMNGEENRSRFNLITRNCADFTAGHFELLFSRYIPAQCFAGRRHYHAEADLVQAGALCEEAPGSCSSRCSTFGRFRGIAGTADGTRALRRPFLRAAMLFRSPLSARTSWREWQWTGWCGGAIRLE